MCYRFQDADGRKAGRTVYKAGQYQGQDRVDNRHIITTYNFHGYVGQVGHVFIHSSQL